MSGLDRIQTQKGTALIMSMVILLILTILGMAALGTSSLEQKMAGNTQEQNRAFQAAESGLARALNSADSFNLNATTTNTYTSDGGRSTATVTTSWIEFTPPRRGSKMGLGTEIAHFKQESQGTTMTKAKTTLEQGVAVVVPKAN